MAFDSRAAMRNPEQSYLGQRRPPAQQLIQQSTPSGPRKIHVVDFVRKNRAMVHYRDGSHELVSDAGRYQELRKMFPTVKPEPVQRESPNWYDLFRF